MADEQPLWRRDFPYTSHGEDEITRREFTKYLVLASAAFAGGGGLISLWASLRTVDSDKIAEVVALDEIEIGGSYLFDYPGPDDPAILVRPTKDVVLGFSQKCTHLGCVVFWETADREFHCPCHEGVFSVEGRPIEGPPDRPLVRVDVEIRDGIVWAVGSGPQRKSV